MHQVGEVIDCLKLLPFHCDVWLLIRLARCRLIHNFSLFCANGETKVVTGFGEAVHFMLNVLLCESVESTVISEQKVSDNRFFHLCDRLQASGVEQLAVSPVSEAGAILRALERIDQHG